MWDKEMTVARQAAREAGEILNNMFGKITRVSKKGEIDLVTEADLESEKTVLRIIRKNFPDDGILTEEEGESGRDFNRLWIIDPLDGTTNFAHSFPFYAVSIALYIDKKAVLGIVYNPCTHEWFEAQREKGSLLNNQLIKVSGTKDINEALIATGFPYNIHENHAKVMELFTKLVVSAQGIRRPGSAAIDLCYVASGIFDGFWEEDLHPWDTAAGALIVEEAGGKLGKFNGEIYSPFDKEIVASNPHIFQQIIDITGG